MAGSQAERWPQILSQAMKGKQGFQAGTLSSKQSYSQVTWVKQGARPEDLTRRPTLQYSCFLPPSSLLPPTTLPFFAFVFQS